MRIRDEKNSDPGWMMFLKYLYNLQQYNRILEEATTLKRYRIWTLTFCRASRRQDRNKQKKLLRGRIRPPNCCSPTVGSAWRGWVAPRRRVGGRLSRDGGSSPPRAALSRSPEPWQPARVIVYHAPYSSLLLIISISDPDSLNPDAGFAESRSNPDFRLC